MVTRIHRSRPADKVRDDIADQLARVIWDIQKKLFETPHMFLVSEVAAEHGVEIGEAA